MYSFMGSRCVSIRNIPRGTLIYTYRVKNINKEPYLICDKNPNTIIHENRLFAYKDIKLGEFLTFSFMPQIKK